MQPGSVERHTGEATLVLAADAAEASLEPGAEMVLDFGMRLIEDHGYKADLRVSRDSTETPITVEVSNDKSRWAECEIDAQISTDYDVPYIGSPWRYVRVSNSSDQPTRIGKVYDLD